jgi:hypothetical protein
MLFRLAEPDGWATAFALGRYGAARRHRRPLWRVAECPHGGTLLDRGTGPEIYSSYCRSVSMLIPFLHYRH